MRDVPLPRGVPLHWDTPYNQCPGGHSLIALLPEFSQGKGFCSIFCLQCSSMWRSVCIHGACYYRPCWLEAQSTSLDAGITYGALKICTPCGANVISNCLAAGWLVQILGVNNTSASFHSHLQFLMKSLKYEVNIKLWSSKSPSMLWLQFYPFSLHPLPLPLPLIEVRSGCTSQGVFSPCLFPLCPEGVIVKESLGRRDPQVHSTK